MEAQPASTFAKTHSSERLVLILTKCVGEEGVHCVVSGKAFLEQEKIVDIVEDAVEVGAQKIRLYKRSVFTQIRRLRLANHGLKIVLVKLFDLLRGDSRETSVLPFWSTVKKLPHPPYLEQKGDIWVDSLFLQQEVVGLLEVLEE